MQGILFADHSFVAIAINSGFAVPHHSSQEGRLASKFVFESLREIHCVDDLGILMSSNFSALDLDGDGFVDNDKVNQCGQAASFLYFITYTLAVTFVILNLVIAVIFEGYDESQKKAVGEVIEKTMEI